MDESDSERQEFLAAQNKVRLHVANPFFVWAPKLAQYSARYTAQRASDCNLVHSGDPYGENKFWVEVSSGPCRHSTARKNSARARFEHGISWARHGTTRSKQARARARGTKIVGHGTGTAR